MTMKFHLPLKLQIAIVLTTILLCASGIVLLATYSIWQAALAGLLFVCSVLLGCTIRMLYLVVRMMQS